MGYNFESSRNENFNEVPEVSTESDNDLELSETEEDYDSCGLNELEGSEQEGGDRSLEDDDDDYSDCGLEDGTDAKAAEGGDRSLEDDDDDYSDCGLEDGTDAKAAEGGDQSLEDDDDYSDCGLEDEADAEADAGREAQPEADEYADADLNEGNPDDPGEVEEGNPEVPGEADEGNPDDPGEVDEGNPEVPGEVDEGNPEVPGEVDETNPDDPGEVEEGNPEVPGEVDEGNPDDPGEVDEGNPDDPGEVDEGNPDDPGEVDEGNPDDPGEVDEGNPDDPGEVDEGNPEVPGEVDEGNPDDPGEVDEGNPEVPGEVDEGNPDDPGEVDEGNPKVPGEVDEGNPDDPGEVDEGNPDDPGEVDEGNPDDPGEVDETNPDDPGEVDEGNPDDPGEVDESNPDDPGEVDEGNPDDPGEVDEGNPDDPGEVDESNPDDPGEVDEGNPDDPGEVDEDNPDDPGEVDEGNPDDPDEVDEGNPDDPGEVDEGNPEVPGEVDETNPDDPGEGDEGDPNKLEDGVPEDSGEGDEGNSEGDKPGKPEDSFDGNCPHCGNPIDQCTCRPDGGEVPADGGDVPPDGSDALPGGQCPRCGNPIEECTCRPDGGEVPADGGDVPPDGGDVPPDGGDVPPNGGDVPPNGGDVPPEGGCPRCGKNPCVCNTYEELVGKRINKLEDLTPQEIAEISRTEEGRQYIKNLHAEMTERYAAENLNMTVEEYRALRRLSSDPNVAMAELTAARNMNMTVEEYRDYRRMSPEHQKRLQETPPPSPTQTELEAAAALDKGRAMHQMFHERSTGKKSKMELRNLSNKLDAEVAQMNGHLESVNLELEKANQEVAFMRSNDLDLKDPEAYARALARQDNLDTMARHLRTQIATLDADMYDCARASGRPYRGSIRPMDEETRQKTLDEARNVLHDGVGNRQEAADALRLAETIRFEAKPELDQKRRETESVIMLLENSQQRYLQENHTTPELAKQDKNSEYARNAAYLENMYAERDRIHKQIVEVDRVENNLRNGLQTKESGSKVEIKDLGNGTVEITYTWQNGVEEKKKEGKPHSAESKFYFNGTERKETYIVGRDDDTLYGHKYSVQYRGVGYEREDTLKKGTAQLKTQFAAGLLNGKLEGGYQMDIDSGKTKGELDAALSIAEVKGQLSTVVNGRESRLLGAEVTVGSLSAGAAVDEHGVKLETLEGKVVAPKVQVAMMEKDINDPFQLPKTMPELLTLDHDIREQTADLQDAARHQWGEKVPGATLLEAKEPLTDRITDALGNVKTEYGDLQKLQTELNDSLLNLKEMQNRLADERADKFKMTLDYPKGTEEYKQALAEFNAANDRMEALNAEVKGMETYKRMLDAQAAITFAQNAEKQAGNDNKSNPDGGVFEARRKNAEEMPGNRFGAYEVGERGFVKGENYDQFIRDWKGYSEDRYHTEMFDTPQIQTVSPSLVEGLRVSDYDIQNPDKFWSMHKSDGTEASFEQIAANIPEVRDRLAQGESLHDLIQDPRVGACASIYFHPNNMPTVIKCGDYYEFQENGRHRILAARNLGYEIPVRVVGERTIEGAAPEAAADVEVSKGNSLLGGVRSFFGNFFGDKDYRVTDTNPTSDRRMLDTLGAVGETKEGHENPLKQRLDELADKKFSELNESERKELVGIMLENMKQRYGDSISGERYERIKENIHFLTGQEAVARGDIKPNEVNCVLGYYKPSGDEIFINISADNDVRSILATLDHEAMHMATEKTDGSYITGLKTNDANIPGRNVGMNEGLTEMYSIRNMQELNPNYVSNSYTDNVMIMRKFETVVGEDVLRNAYMDNDFDGLRAAYDAKMGAGSFDNFCNLMDSMHRDYNQGYYIDGDKKRDQLMVMLDGTPGGPGGSTKAFINSNVITLEEISERRVGGSDPSENFRVAEVDERIVRALEKVRMESAQIDYSQLDGRDALTETEKITIEQQLDRVFANCDYCIQIHGDALEGVFKSGEFYSQTSHGCDEMTRVTKDPTGRRVFSEYHYGAVMDEKFGYACQFREEMSNGGRDCLNRYGDIMVNFKKEAVEGKMTYYLGDSLAGYRTMKDGADPHLGVVGGEHGGTTLSGLLIKYNQDILDAANRCEMDPFAYVPDNGYLEIQFLGRLVVDDIASIGFLNEQSYNMLSPELKKYLADKDIDVFIRQPDGSLKQINAEIPQPPESPKQDVPRRKKWFGLF